MQRSRTLWLGKQASMIATWATVIRVCRLYGLWQAGVGNGLSGDVGIA